MTTVTTASGSPVVIGAAKEFTFPLDLAEGESLENKDLRATIRASSDDQTAVHASLEGIAVSVADGVASFSLTAEQTSHLDAPRSVTQTRGYYIEFFVPDDSWVAEALVKFNVRRAAANLSTGG